MNESEEGGHMTSHLDKILCCHAVFTAQVNPPTYACPALSAGVSLVVKRLIRLK